MKEAGESHAQTPSEMPEANPTKKFNQKGGMLWSGLIESGVIQYLNADDLKVLMYYVTMGQGSSTRITETQAQIAKKLGLTPPRVSRAVNRLCGLPKKLGLEGKMPPILFDEERQRRESQESSSTATNPKAKSATRQKLLRFSIHPFWGHKGSHKNYQMRWHLYYSGHGMQERAIKNTHRNIQKALLEKKDESPPPESK